MPEWQEILIAQIVASLKRDYVFKEKINEDFASALRNAFIAQFSNLATEPSDAENIKEFGSAVTQILKNITQDEHLVLEYDPVMIAKNKPHEHANKFPWQLSSQIPPELIEPYSIDFKSRGCGYYDITKPIPPEMLKKLMPRHLKIIEENMKFKDSIPNNVGYVGMFTVLDPKEFEVVREKIFDTMQSMQNKDAIISVRKAIPSFYLV